MSGYAPSKRLRAAAAAELAKVDRAIAKVDDRERGVQAQLAALQATRDDLNREGEALAHFAAGETATAAEPQPRTGPAVKALQGAKIRETAVRVLAARPDDAAGIHYRDWYRLLQGEGFEVVGADPLASFLTQISRSPVVQRSTQAGFYSLDFGFVRRAHERHAALGEQASAEPALPSSASVQEIVAARERRQEVAAEMRKLSRQLEEALRSLGRREVVAARP